MSHENFEQILKEVSRSFYLSLRILPKDMRQPVAIAYLLARAADSMADSDNITQDSRAEYLSILLDQMIELNSSIVDNLSTSLSVSMNHDGERKLIQNLPKIIPYFHQLDTTNKKQVHDVVKTLISGMQLDLSTFSHNANQIVALKDQHALDTYTYLVAGCVGEFWTKSAIKNLSNLSSWDEKKQTQLGIEFGKALQLTNILRDIAKDAKIGRCYLPHDALESQQLTTEMLLNKENIDAFRPLIFKQINRALTYFESAENYLINTPRSEIRLRLASLWPILIGLKTLQLISHKANFLDPEINIKVDRKWVYRMLIKSLVVIHSNTLSKNWIKQIKQNIHCNDQ